VRTVREHQRVLLEQLNPDESGLDRTMLAIPGGRSNVEELRTFVFGETKDGNIILFWNEIRKLSCSWYTPYCCDRTFDRRAREMCSLLKAISLNGEITYLVGLRSMELIKHAVYSPIGSLAVQYIASIATGSDQSIENARALQELITGALGHGYDLHAHPGNRISPLLILLHPEPMLAPRRLDGTRHRPYIDMKRFLHIWLSLLKSIGIDLLSYGETEWRMLQQLRHTSECDRPWDWWHGAETHRCYGDVNNFDATLDSCPALLSFSYGADVSDWTIWVYHPGDQYAGQFWRMVEQDGSGLGAGVDYCPQSIPGGWVEDE
jgi:hypothetical protein